MGHPTPWAEGCVVRIETTGGKYWIANLQPDHGYASKIVDWNAANAIIVIAKGACYLLYPDIPDKWTFIDNPAIDCKLTPKQDMAIISTYSSVIAISPNGRQLWKRRIAIDGIEIMNISDELITGNACIDPTDDWQPFTLSAVDGKRR
jgi:hypothetical protein